MVFYMQEKMIYEHTNEILILHVCDILKENGINFIRRDEGIGSYLNKRWGSNSEIKRIYISNEDYEKAKEILKILDKKNQEKEETNEELDEINKYKKMKHILFVWIPFTMTMILIISFIIAIIRDSI